MFLLHLYNHNNVAPKVAKCTKGDFNDDEMFEGTVCLSLCVESVCVCTLCVREMAGTELLRYIILKHMKAQRP